MDECERVCIEKPLEITSWGGELAKLDGRILIPFVLLARVRLVSQKLLVLSLMGSG